MGFKADDVFDLVYYTIRFCAWQVDFVDDWKYIKVMIQCKVYICKCLGFNSLCSVYYKDCTIAGSKASGYFVVEVDMSWGVNKVKDIFFAVFGFVYDSDCLRFDGDSSFSFEIHVIKNLRLHLTFGQGTGHFDDSVGKGGFAVVYMCNNAEISDFTLIYHSGIPSYYFLFSPIIHRKYLSADGLFRLWTTLIG